MRYFLLEHPVTGRTAGLVSEFNVNKWIDHAMVRVNGRTRSFCSFFIFSPALDEKDLIYVISSSSYTGKTR